MSLSEFDFAELGSQHDLSLFDCDDKDINEFLKDDALKYQQQRMSNTYLFLEESNDIAAFFSISNDCLTDRGVEKGYDNTSWNRFHRKQSIPNSKRIKQYPAVKIGRLGVSKKYHGTGLSYELMQFIKGYSITEHKPAVRLLILDAYNKEKQIKFYTRNGFTFMLDTDVNSITRLMIYDLIKLS